MVWYLNIDSGFVVLVLPQQILAQLLDKHVCNQVVFLSVELHKDVLVYNAEDLIILHNKPVAFYQLIYMTVFKLDHRTLLVLSRRDFDLSGRDLMEKAPEVVLIN